MRHPCNLVAAALLSAAPLASDAAESQHEFHIPAQSLAGALQQLAKQAGSPLFFAEQVAAGKRSQALNGRYSVRQALEKLLGGSGLSYSIGADGAISIRSATSQSGPIMLGKVTVTAAAPAPAETGYAITQAYSATRTDTPIMETPYSVKAVPQEVIRDQQAVRFEKALQNVSGVIREPAGNLTVESFNIRGFQSFYTYRDGLRMSIPSSPRETANVERIEVLKGPGSILFGRADPGGIINAVTKQPLHQGYYAFQQQFGSFDFYRTMADATGPITTDTSLAYRFNLAYENAGSFKEFNHSEHTFLAPVLRWEISPQTQVSLELEYLDNHAPSDVGIPAIGGKPAKLPRERNLSESWARQNNDYTLVGLNWSHAFTDQWTVRHRFNTQLLNDAQTTLGRNSTDADGTDHQWYGTQNEQMDTYYNTVDLTGKFETFGVAHTLIVGNDYYKLNDRVAYNDYSADNGELLINIYNPIHRNRPPLIPGVNSELSSGDNTTEWYAFFIQDQLDLPFGLHALAGLRYDNATNTDNLANSSYEDDRVSPRGGLIWRPIPEWSMYGSYTENFGATNGLDRENKPLPPQTAQQWEVGMKTELANGRFLGTIAWFELTKQNMPAIDPTFPLRSIAIGEVQSRGLEIDVSGEVLPGWRVIGAYAYTPYANVIKDYNQDSFGQVNTGNEGHRNANVPRNSGSLWTTYEFAEGDFRGLALGAGVVGIGQRQGDLANSYRMPGYATVNLSASYQMKVGPTKATFQLNVDNLLDKDFFAGSNGGSNIHVGTPRLFMGAVRLEY